VHGRPITGTAAVLDRQRVEGTMKCGRSHVVSLDDGTVLRAHRARQDKDRLKARRFLEHVQGDPLYAAYVLILVLGLRRGAVLGPAWDCVNLANDEIHIARQLTRVGGQLLHRDKTKTDDSSASLLAALDVHPRVAMHILRHSQVSVTMNVYTQIPSPETRKVLNRLNAGLDSAHIL
jgi:integrase